ncbi:response regulator [Blastococcus sp. SYSU DS0539]
MTVRVLIVDDEDLVRTGLRLILESEPDLTVVGTAGNGAAGVAAATRFRPDVVLMDVRMPVLDGLSATRQILGGPVPGCRVVVLTTLDLDEHVYEALRAGASGFLLKDVPADQLVHAIRVVAAGEALLAPSVTRRLIAAFSRQAPVRPAETRPAVLSALTDREAEVLALLVEGLSNAEIADRLVVGEATVKTHVARVLTKLGVRDRVQAVIVAFRAGLVPVDPHPPG